MNKKKAEGRGKIILDSDTPRTNTARRKGYQMSGQTEISPSAASKRSIDEEFRIALQDKDQDAIEYFALALLLSRPLYALEFATVMDSILDISKMSAGWKSAFERAYEAQPESRRVLYRDSMAKLYLALGDSFTAARFLPAKQEL